MTTLRSSETLRNAALAGLLASFVAWVGPPGTDFAAHVFQLHVYLQHGFALWTNYWYAGRYTFVGYSVLYYPLAALFGIRLLAVLSAVASTAAFTLVLRQTWGDATVWATRFFAIVAAASVVSAAFPYGLGLALALTALVALARHRLIVFGILAALTLAASPLAFLFLLVVLAAAGISRSGREILRPAAIAGTLCAIGLLVWRLFPDHGVYPFSLAELAAALLFCSYGAALTWRVENARLLRALFVAYGAVCVLAYLIPSNLGENVARLRFAALPIAVLALSLRPSPPRLLSVVCLTLALSWNVTPLAASFQRGTTDAARNPLFWAKPIAYLHQHLSPAYRVEAVDTAGHWEALYLAQAGIPLTRGWFRQDDFPQNRLLYDELGVRGYLHWLRQLSVRYIVLTDGPLDYSARGEAALVRAHPQLFPVVLRFRGGVVLSVSNPLPLVRGGPAPAHVDLVGATSIAFTAAKPGRYSMGVRYSPYLTSKDACIRRLPGGFTGMTVRKPGRVRIHFSVGATSAARAITGRSSSCP